MSFKLYATYGNYRGNEIKVAADISGIKLEEQYMSWSDLKSKENVKRHPLGKIPTIETPEGFIFETNAILRFLARQNPEKGLYGQGPQQQALVDQWLDFSNCEISPPVSVLYKVYWGWKDYEHESFKNSKTEFLKNIRVLEEHLKGKTYLVGDKLTIADLSLAGLIVIMFRFMLAAKFRKSIPNLVKWMDLVSKNEMWLKHWGPVNYCEKEWDLPESKAAPSAPVKKEEKKKEEKKKKEKKEAVEDDEEAPEKKAKNPLDDLPPTTFNLFDFKTLFVNATDKQEACNFLWEHFDKQGFSLWKITYEKAEGEGKILFQTNNLYNGFLQRLESFRKYSFGVHGVYGDEPNLEIRGIWLWRGTDHPLEIKEHPSYEWNKFTKLDSDNVSDKKLLEEYWCRMTPDVDVVEGLTVRDVKYFK